MKYYSFLFKEYNGEQEYTYHYLIEAQNKREAEKIAHHLLKDWYGDGGKKEKDGTYTYGCGCPIVKPYGIYKTTKEAFIESLLRRWMLTKSTLYKLRKLFGGQRYKLRPERLTPYILLRIWRTK